MLSLCVSVPLTHTLTHIHTSFSYQQVALDKIYLPRKLYFLIHVIWKGMPCSNTHSSLFQSPNLGFQSSLIKLATVSNIDVAVVWLCPCYYIFSQGDASRRRGGPECRSPQGWTDLLLSPGLGQLMWLPGGYSALNWKCHQSPLINHYSPGGTYGVTQASSLQVFLLRN